MLKFCSPRDGQMLTNTAGRPEGDGLRITVRLQADAGQNVLVNGQPAQFDGVQYCAQVLLQQYCQEIRAKCGQETASITLYWLPQATHAFSFGVDDNIWWLQDLAEHPQKSLFDHPYLRMFRELSMRTGIKVRFNLFAETPRRNGFRLEQMPACYREEFREQADWMHLAFHSAREIPANPYMESGYDEVAADCARVMGEICRFAGSEVLESAATVHYCRATAEGVRALRDQGIDTLFGFAGADATHMSYTMTQEESLLAAEYGFWKSRRDDMAYGRIDCVLNSFTPEEIPAELERGRQLHPNRGCMDILIHEQYFYPDYPRYLPDFRERILAGVEWCLKRGMRPAFAEELTKPW